MADKNKVYDKELVAEKKKIDGYQARIAKRKLELEMAEHLASLSAAEAAVKVGVKDGGFDAAEEAVANLERRSARARSSPRPTPSTARAGRAEGLFPQSGAR